MEIGELIEIVEIEPEPAPEEVPVEESPVEVPAEEPVESEEVPA